MGPGLSYDVPGATEIANPDWTAAPRGYRRYERTARLGHGSQTWEAAASAVLAWAVKTRSGFKVEVFSENDLVVGEGQDRVLLASIGPVRLREPVRVVAVIDAPDRAGFAYGTRDGHPVSGEEAFVVHRSPEGDVFLTIRSLTRPAVGLWRLAFPAALIAQRWYRRRYLRSLVGR